LKPKNFNLKKKDILFFGIKTAMRVFFLCTLLAEKKSQAQIIKLENLFICYKIDLIQFFFLILFCSGQKKTLQYLGIKSVFFAAKKNGEKQKKNNEKRKEKKSKGKKKRLKPPETGGETPPRGEGSRPTGGKPSHILIRPPAALAVSADIYIYVPIATFPFVLPFLFSFGFRFLFLLFSLDS